EQPADLAEQTVEVLWLDGDHDERRAGHRLRVREGPAHAVPLRQLLDPFLAPAGDDHMPRLAPTRAEQSGEQRLADLSSAEDRDFPRGHPRSLPSNSLLLGECGFVVLQRLLVAEDEAAELDLQTFVHRL